MSFRVMIVEEESLERTNFKIRKNNEFEWTDASKFVLRIYFSHILQTYLYFRNTAFKRRLKSRTSTLLKNHLKYNFNLPSQLALDIVGMQPANRDQFLAASDAVAYREQI
jgi:hypothetical protein